MAFDLNKNNGTDKASSGKNPGSGFNLSKERSKNNIAEAHSSKSKIWIIGLIVILIAGSAIWYYSSPATVVNQEAATDLPTAQIAKKAIANTETVVSGQRETASKKTAIAALDHKIPATFGRGSSSMISIDQSLIKNIISYLANNPDASININGYASSDGTLEVNQTISQARADAFKKYLVSKHIAESRMIAIGKGIENPIASNDTGAGRKRNRRIEIILP